MIRTFHELVGHGEAHDDHNRHKEDFSNEEHRETSLLDAGIGEETHGTGRLDANALFLDDRIDRVDAVDAVSAALHLDVVASHFTFGSGKVTGGKSDYGRGQRVIKGERAVCR